MKLSALIILLSSSFTIIAAEHRVLLPPFENLSSRRSPVEYEISAGGFSERLPTRNKVDRFSHVPREVLEDIVAEIKGVRPVERQRLDQFYLENQPGTAHETIEGEYVAKAMLKLEAPVAVQGTILSLYERSVDYKGYVRLKSHFWSAKVRIRIYSLVGGKLEIPYSKILNGSSTIVDTPTAREISPDDESALGALSNALEDLRDDEQFAAAVRSGSHQSDKEMMEYNTVKIPFDVTPEGADIFIDEIWRAKSPCRLNLEADKPVLLRIEKKPSYESWQAKILPSRNLRITQELQPVLHPVDQLPAASKQTKGKP